jgi:hypothetical protein
MKSIQGEMLICFLLFLLSSCILALKKTEQ